MSNLYKSIFNFSSEGIAIYINEKVKDANLALAKMFGAEYVKDLLEYSLFNENFTSTLKENLALNKREFKYKTINLQGEAIVLECSVKQAEIDGEVAQLVFVNLIIESLDLSESKEKEQELIDSEEKFHKAFMASPYSLSIIRLNTGEILEINKGFEKNLGFKRNEVLGKNPYELGMVEDDGDSFEKFNSLLLENGSVENFEVNFLRKDGQVLNAILNAEIIYLRGEPAILSIGNNVTQLKKAYKELEEYKLKLEDIVDERTKQLVETNKKLKDEIEERNRINTELKQSRNKYKNLTNYLGTKYFTYSYDKESVIQHISQGASYIFEKPVEQLLNHKYAEITNWLEEDFIKSSDLSERLLSGLVFEETITMSFVTPSGKTKTINVYGRAGVNENGEVTNVDGVCEDISDDLAFQEELKTVNYQLDMAIWGASLGMWDWKIETGEVKYNTTFAENLGYNLSEIESYASVWEELYHEDDKDKVLADLVEHIKRNDDELYETEVRLKTKSGDWKWFLARGKIAKRNSEGKPVRHIGVYIDISKQKQVEKKLKDNSIELQERVKELQGIYALSLLTEKNDDVDFVSKKLVEEIIPNSMPFPDKTCVLLSIKDKDFTNECGCVLSESEKCLSSDIRVKGKKIGCLRVKFQEKVPLVDLFEQNLINTYAERISIYIERIEIGKEIVEVKKDTEKAYDELRIMHEELKTTQEHLINSEKMASIGILSAGIAHEINNPISYISGGMAALKFKHEDLVKIIDQYKALANFEIKERSLMLTELLNNKELDSVLVKSERMMSHIQKGIDQTINIIDALKVFTDNQSESFFLANFNELIENVLTILYNKYKNKVEIVKELGDIPEILCSSGKISQVIMNLLLNSIQAVTENGVIVISTSLKNENHIEFSVKDNGGGIPDEIKKKIYDPFYTTKEVGVGTGLGLYLVYTIVKQHKGNISFESAIGKGTTFKVLLPVNNKD